MIKKLKWDNCKALGNLQLDFTKEDGTIYNTIILAGENGTGKTTILETLTGYLNGETIMPFEYIEYAVDDGIFRILPLEQNGHIGYHKRVDINSGVAKDVYSGRNHNREQINKDTKDLRHYGFAYSKARSGFRTQQVKSSTTLQVDDDKYEPDTIDDFTRIKQLLVDISLQDSSDWIKKCEAGGLSDYIYGEFKRQSKQYRFKSAFDNFFNNIKYEGINNDDPDEKKVMFRKYGNLISVDDLSTGEKQIVFRGAHLLRNVNNMKGGIVLVDEPELSMHPLWQKEILEYYRNLFVINRKQIVQMIVATHSEYVIQSALKDRDNVLIIALSDENGIIRSRNIDAPNALSVVTSAETNYLAFGVLSTDYHIELYGYLQTKTGYTRIEDCDKYITQQPQYEPYKHEKIDNTYQNHHYQTLPTYIRNAIDHPDSNRSYTEAELEESIKLLRELVLAIA